jgi:drug/metabolite transporter (DMT)-like permease
VISGILAGLAAGALWGLVFVVPYLTPGLTAVDLAAGRFLSFGVFSASVLLLTLGRRKLPTPMQALAALWMSILGFSGYYLLLVLAIREMGAEVPTLIIGTIPLWMLILGRPLGLKVKTLLPGMALTATGLLLMMLADLTPVLGLTAQADGLTAQPSANSGNYWLGVFYACAAMVSWTIYGLQNALWLRRHPEVSATDWANWLGLAAGLGAMLLWLLAGSDVKTLQALDNQLWLAAVCIVTGVSSAWLPTILWNIASQRLSASLCGQLIVSETIFGLLYTFAWKGQWPLELQLVAVVLFVLGIWASVRAHR